MDAEGPIFNSLCVPWLFPLENISWTTEPKYEK